MIGPFFMTPYATALFHTAAFPPTAEYFIPVGNGKVLISLATHLDQDQVVEMAIAKIVEKVSEGSKQTACILSLQHTVIVEIDKSCRLVKVKRTKLLRILHERAGTPGDQALIATLSPFRRRITPPLQQNPASDRALLPLEVVELVFRSLALQHPDSIPNFASTCKQFATIVSKNTLRFPGCTLFPFAIR